LFSPGAFAARQCFQAWLQQTESSATALFYVNNRGYVRSKQSQPDVPGTLICQSSYEDPWRSV